MFWGVLILLSSIYSVFLVGEQVHTSVMKTIFLRLFGDSCLYAVLLKMKMSQGKT